MMKVQKSKDIPADGDLVEGVQQANNRFNQCKTQNSSVLDAYCDMTMCILAGIESKEKAAELEKLGWHYLETGEIMSAFSIFHRLIRREDAPPSVFDGLATFYERYNHPESALSCCRKLELCLKNNGQDEELPALYERIKNNYRHLSEKAINYENTGNFRFAFNSYRWMIEENPTDMEAFAGYLRNSIPSGKPGEPYKNINQESEYKRVILSDDNLAMMYANLVKFIEENPEYLESNEIDSFAG